MAYAGKISNDTNKENQSEQYEILEKRETNVTGLDVLYTSRIDYARTDGDVEKKVLSLKHLLERDPKAADLKWSFFVAASNTYRFDSCLKPFPPMYIKNECKDIEALVLIALIFMQQRTIQYQILSSVCFLAEKSHRISSSFTCDM